MGIPCQSTELLFVVDRGRHSRRGFIPSNGDTFFQQTLNKGHIHYQAITKETPFVFRKGHVHYQTNAVQPCKPPQLYSVPRFLPTFWNKTWRWRRNSCQPSGQREMKFFIHLDSVRTPHLDACFARSCHFCHPTTSTYMNSTTEVGRLDDTSGWQRLLLRAPRASSRRDYIKQPTWEGGLKWKELPIDESFQGQILQRQRIRPWLHLEHASRS